MLILEMKLKTPSTKHHIDSFKQLYFRRVSRRRKVFCLSSFNLDRRWWQIDLFRWSAVLYWRGRDLGCMMGLFVLMSSAEILEGRDQCGRLRRSLHGGLRTGLHGCKRTWRCSLTCAWSQRDGTASVRWRATAWGLWSAVWCHDLRALALEVLRVRGDADGYRV